MPGRDGTGPMSQGAMSGRGAGNCSDPAGLDQNTGFGTGRGLGAGIGRGIARGARMGLGLGLGYGCRRLMRRNLSGARPMANDRENLAREKDFLQRRLDRISQLLDDQQKER